MIDRRMNRRNDEEAVRCTDIQMNKLTEKQLDLGTNRHGRQTDGQTYEHADRWADKHMYT